MAGYINYKAMAINYIINANHEDKILDNNNNYVQNSYMGGAYIIINLPTTAWGSDSDQ